MCKRCNDPFDKSMKPWMGKSWNRVVEDEESGLERTYLWGMDLSGTMQGAGGVGGLLRVRDSGQKYEVTYDGNGNVSEYLSVSGEVVGHYEYDAFGRVVERRGVMSGVLRHGFSTKQRDEETGWSDYGYRYYDAETGRWLSRDPLTDEMFLWQIVNMGPFEKKHLEWLNSAIYGNIYSFLNNQTLSAYDISGLLSPGGNGQWGGWHPPLLPGVTRPSQGNCWRYACNDPAKQGEPHSPFPGGPDPGGVLTCDQVKKGAKANGAKEPDGNGDCPKCHYKIKLVLQPDNGDGWNDYHWYRQDDDGSWSHKPGQTDVISGVTDPAQDAKKRGYTTDCGELCAPEKGVDVD